MARYALEEVDNAVDETKELLLPFDKGTWSRLLLLAVLTGSSFNAPNFPSGGFPEDSSGDLSHTSAELNSDVHRAFNDITPQRVTGMSTLGAGSAMALIIAVFGLIIVGLIILLIIISGVFEFVYYQSLLDGNVRIRSNSAKHFGKGLQYIGFLFTTLIGFLMLFLVMLSPGIVSPVLAVPGLIIGLLLIVPLMIFLGLTQNFILLKMIENDSGIVAAWKEFYSDISGQWNEIGIYILVRFGLKIVGSLMAVLWALLTLLVLAIPFGIIGVLAYMVSEILLGLVVIIGLLTWVLSILVIDVPIQTYLRFYAILVYHDLTS